MHRGIVHEDERILTARPLSPVNNILSQSVADVAPAPQSSRALRFLDRAQSTFGDPSIQAGATTLGRGIGGGELRKPSETLEIFRASADIQRAGGIVDVAPSVTSPSITPTAITPGTTTTERGISPTPSAPILDDIDFTSTEGILKGFGSVAKFTQDLGRFNRARGITPGGRGRKGIKTSDIQNRIKFLEEQRIEGLFSEEQEAEITDEINILTQSIQGRLGVTKQRRRKATERIERTADEERIRKLIKGES